MTVRQIAPGRHRTVVEVLREAADLNADVEAYVEPAVPWTEVPSARRSLTFSSWNRAADGLAGLLAARGVGRGDVVCLLLPSSIDYAVCYAAALRLGAVTSGVNPRLGSAEIESVVGRAHPVLTVVDPALGVALPPGAGTVVTRAEAATAWDGPPPARFPELYEDDPVAVVWTSGTTGRPKGAVFDHRCLAAVFVGADVLSRPGDRRLSPLPFAHVGYMTKAWDEIAHGITTVITPTPWRATDALWILEEERITVAQGVPTQWALVLALEELDRADLSSLRIAGTGAAPMPATQVAELRQRLGVPVVVRYACTETAICTGTLPDDPDEVVATSVGRPVPGVELSLVGEAGQEVASGQPGRVRIRSGAVMRGYWGDGPSPATGGPDGPSPRGVAHLVDPEATARVLSDDGWVTTGDFGIVGEDGNLRLVGRENERYIRGGYNVYPVEVEDVLVTHSAVARAAVVGTPDPVLGEVGVAFVVPSTDPQPGGAGPAMPPLAELRAYCAERLADYKAPDALVVIDELPLTPMMKVDKRSLEGPARDAAAACPARHGGSDHDATGRGVRTSVTPKTPGTREPEVPEKESQSR
jgi:acyl-CoA synthetase (AMP-forming)/AMP-acid ligase II